ncbi:MAG: hypothetical protein ACP5IC_01920 [Minisyncoccia bacterium]
MSRGTKQFIYSMFFFLILIFLGYIFLYPFLKTPATCFDNIQNQGETGVDCGGPCEPCVIKNVQPLTISNNIKVLNNGSYQAVLVQISNNNIDVDAQNFVYTVSFYDNNGHIINSQDGNDFIAAGSQKYLDLFNTGNNFVAKATLQIVTTTWVLSDQSSKPNVILQNLQYTTTTNSVEISGKVVNQNSFDVWAKILAIINTTANTNLFVYHTVINNISSLQSNDFHITVPLSTDLLNRLDLNKTQVIVYAKKL